MSAWRCFRGMRAGVTGRHRMVAHTRCLANEMGAVTRLCNTPASSRSDARWRAATMPACRLRSTGRDGLSGPRSTSTRIAPQRSDARGARGAGEALRRRQGERLRPWRRRRRGAALDAGAAGLGVVCVDEGEELRRARHRRPRACPRLHAGVEAERIVELRLTPTVDSMETARALSRHARDVGHHAAASTSSWRAG